MDALGILRKQGWTYEDIGPRVGASSRSVRRWDRLRVKNNGLPAPSHEARPLPVYSTKLVELASSEGT